MTGSMYGAVEEMKKKKEEWDNLRNTWRLQEDAIEYAVSLSVYFLSVEDGYIRRVY